MDNERYKKTLPDGITDTKNNDEHISNWEQIAEILNTKEEIIRKQYEKIEKLEELLIIRKIQDKHNKQGIKIDLSDINGICDYIQELEHELNTIEGLYASDNPEFTEPFKLNFQKTLRKKNEQ